MRFLSPRTAATDPAHPHSIRLKLRDMNQLFNSMDPSPFIEKDLDDDAEEFIVSWAQEFSPKMETRLNKTPWSSAFLRSALLNWHLCAVARPIKS
jgi:hypothetical protein